MAEVKKLKVVINGRLSKEACQVDVGRKRLQRERSASSACKASTNKAQKLDPQEPCTDITHEHDIYQKSEKLMFSFTEIYSKLLKSPSAIVPISNDNRAFLIQGFDEVKKVLKNYYVVLERRLVTISGQCQWVYSCSCDHGRKRLIKNLPDVLEEDFNKDGLYEECMHIKSAKDVIEENHPGFNAPVSLGLHTDTDDHSYEKPKMNIDIYGVPENNSVVCVRWEEACEASYHIIRVDYSTASPELKCVTCRINNCMHCKAVIKQDINATDLPTNILHALNQTMKWRSRYIPVSVSTNKIPFSCRPEEQKANRTSFFRDAIHLKPEEAAFCICGGQMGEPILVDEVKIFTSTNMLDAKVYSRHCTQCDGIREYDGCDDQILNMGSYMVSHDVLRDFLRQFVTQGCTMASFYKQWCWRQLESGMFNFTDECPYNRGDNWTGVLHNLESKMKLEGILGAWYMDALDEIRFRYAWYSFLKLLDIDFKQGFMCPECGDYPETVVMDGVCLGLRKSFMPWRPAHAFTHSTVYDGSSHNTRVFVNNAETRQLLLKFVEKELTDKEMQLLQQKVGLYQPSLCPLLNLFLEEGIKSSPPMFKDFIKVLASNYPVCGFLHYNENLFNTMENPTDFTTEEMVLLERETPVISTLLSNFKWKTPIFLKPVFKELVSKAKAPFEGASHNIPCCGETCECRGIGFFPNLRTISHRGTYVLDNKKRQNNGGCTKKRSSHPSLIPGLFTVSCIHGVCYGYDVMEDPESPNVPFTILRTRFQKAPKMIIYDNACNLHEYCLNRDPVFFRDSWFVIDRFHWCNHVGCHAGYNLDNYPQFKDVNTQVAEQRNSTLKKLKSMLSYMNVENFKGHLNLFIWFRSMLTLANIEHESFFDENLILFRDLSKVYTNIWGK